MSLHLRKRRSRFCRPSVQTSHHMTALQRHPGGVQRREERKKNNTQNNSELPVSCATGGGGTVVLGPVMEQKQRSEHSSTGNADFLSFSVRLTHGNSTEFPHDSSSPANVTPGSPALVGISRIGCQRQQTHLL